MRAKDYRARAWNALKGKIGNYAVVTIIFSAITAGIAAIPFIGILSLFVAGPLTLGITIISLMVAKNQKFQISNMFDGFKNFLNSFLLMLINQIFIVLWTLLFVIPGIVKTYAYSMSFYIMADNPELDQETCRKRSMEMMEGHKWELFCLHFSFIGWAILSSLTFGIGFVFLIPYVQTATAEFYLNLKGEDSVNVAYVDDGFVIKHEVYDAEELKDEKN